MAARESKEIQIAVPWGHIAAKAYGSPSAVELPVLLIHGILDNAGSFHRLIQQLPANRYYVAIDLPGHGCSSHMPAGLPLNFYDYILAIRYVIVKLGWSKFHLIGHSLGAQLSIFYSLIYQGVQRLVIVEGFYPRVLPERERLPYIRKTLESAAQLLHETDARTFTRDEVMHTLRCKRKFALKSAAAEAMFERSVSEIGDGRYRYNRDPRLKDYVLPLLNLDQLMCLIQQVSAKTLGLFTHSSAKIFTPELVRESTSLVESLIDIKMIFVEGNHDVHNNHPERLAPYIIKFWDDCSLTSKL